MSSSAPLKQAEIYQMSLDEVKLLEAAKTDPNLLFDYWFRKPEMDRAFQLDYDITDPWQIDYCMAAQTLIVVVAGISTGKTLTAGMTACFHALMNQDFKFLNIGYELKQSEYMYDAILEFARGTRFEKLISKKPRRPNPQILLEFKIGNILRRATLDFMSAGENNDAMNVFSYRGDIINVEECGRFINLESLIAHLTTRLTGTTASGRPYMGRLSLISNPHENPELWEIFDKAKLDPEHALVFNIDTKSNKNTTQAQLEAQLRNMTLEEQERFLTGKRPEGKGLYFNKDVVKRNSSEVLSERLLAGIASEAAGWVKEESTSLAVYHYKMPPQKERIYLMTGDPGISNPPFRNAPVIMVFDVTEAPKSVFMTALWWGFGRGSIQPFITEFLATIELYKPEFAGVDSTSTQRNMAELMNLDYIWGQNKSVEQITGMDFSGPKKPAYLVSLRLTLEQNRLQWAHIAKGIGSQLRKYDPMEDKSGTTTSKLPQDLVSALAMGAFAIRAIHGMDTEDSANGDKPNENDLHHDSRSGQSSTRERRGESR